MNQTSTPWWRNRTNLALAVFVGIGGYFLFTEYRAHFIAVLPWVLVLGCLVMCLFMHGSHGHGSSGHKDSNEDQRGGGS
jgi:hypothetical protein